jgi:hypothetical protein
MGICHAAAKGRCSKRATPFSTASPGLFLSASEVGCEMPVIWFVVGMRVLVILERVRRWQGEGETVPYSRRRPAGVVSSD